MCTAIGIKDLGLFGRTLDAECSFGECPVRIPSHSLFEFLRLPPVISSSTIVGTALTVGGSHLFFDGANGHGLAAAGLNFPRFASYKKPAAGKTNLASFELIQYILSTCKSTDEARAILENANITDDSYSSELPATPMHWIIFDRFGSIAVEPCEEGLRIYDDPYGVLTNSPPFPYHEANSSNHLGTDPKSPENKLCPNMEIPLCSLGTGAMGLPGDHSSQSRFIRALFASSHLTSDKQGRISDFFSLMSSLSIPKGSVLSQDNKPHFTTYISCADLIEGCYYFSSHRCRRLTALKISDRDQKGAVSYPIDGKEDIKFL